MGSKPNFSIWTPCNILICIHDPNVWFFFWGKTLLFNSDMFTYLKCKTFLWNKKKQNKKQEGKKEEDFYFCQRYLKCSALQYFFLNSAWSKNKRSSLPNFTLWPIWKNDLFYVECTQYIMNTLHNFSNRVTGHKVRRRLRIGEKLNIKNRKKVCCQPNCQITQLYYKDFFNGIIFFTQKNFF